MSEFSLPEDVVAMALPIPFPLFGDEVSNGGKMAMVMYTRIESYMRGMVLV